MDKETAIKAISEKLLLLKDINNYKKFMNWQTTVVGTLSNIYTASDKRVESFQRISSYAVYFDTTIDKTNDAKESAEELLNSLIKDLENFGIVKFSSDSSKTGVNINVNQNNHQNQSTSISFQLDFLVEILKDELKGGQVKELKAILESSDEPEKKTKRFIDKIKSFGSDVASNILANLLTNPQVYEGLGSML
jgi:hypothetical protein